MTVTSQWLLCYMLSDNCLMTWLSDVWMACMQWVFAYGQKLCFILQKKNHYICTTFSVPHFVLFSIQLYCARVMCLPDSIMDSKDACRVWILVLGILSHQCVNYLGMNNIRKNTYSSHKAQDTGMTPFFWITLCLSGYQIAHCMYDLYCLSQDSSTTSLSFIYMWPKNRCHKREWILFYCNI